jgi:tetratricopeptide (TPR) repeat protein
LHASLSQHQAGNLDAAMAGYRAFLQEQPNHAEANRLLGLALFARGQVADARAALERAAESPARVIRFRLLSPSLSISLPVSL